MWIRVCPNWPMNINSKNGRKRSFPYETKAPISFVPMRRMCLWCPIIKRKRLLCESVFIPIEKQTLIQKMAEWEVFLMEPKHQFIYPNAKKEFVVPIIKRKEIIMWMHIYPNWKMNFNSKNGWKKCFSLETNAPISFIPIRRMCLWCLIIKRK